VSVTARRQEERGGDSNVSARRVRRSRGGWWVASVLLLFISLLVSVAIAAVAMFELRYQDRIYPGVRVDPVDLSGMTRSEAQAKLTALYDQASPWWPILSYGEKVWIPSREDLGISIDVEQSVQLAYAVGRSRNPLQSLGEQLDAYRYGRSIQPAVRCDRAEARRYLSTLAQEIQSPVREATLRVDVGQVEITPSRVGYELDEVATLDMIEARVTAWQGGEVKLAVREIEPVIADISGLAERVERIISAPIELIGPDDVLVSRWELSPKDLLEMLTLEQRVESDGRIVGIAALSEPAIRERVMAIATLIERPPAEGRVDYNVRLAQVIVVEPSQVGYQLDVEKTIELIRGHSLSQNREIVLPVEELQPVIDTDNLPELGIKEQIAEATSYFRGSSRARMTNIAVAASQFDGILLSPGEIFSFNKYLGDVSAEQGYEESLIIWGDRTAVGIGGGVCQVSTTAFRAAFWAGLEIIERWAHGYRVGWYEPPVGLDATVYSPVVDFKFRNDTPHYMLIKTETNLNDATVTFYFYGTDTGRTVEMEGPIEENVVAHGPAEYQNDSTLPAGTVKQIDWAHDGVDVTVKRIVRQDGEVLHDDTFFSRYQPWKAVFLVGTGGESTKQ